MNFGLNIRFKSVHMVSLGSCFFFTVFELTDSFDFAESDVILLDDPLSAVDAHVGQHLWLECICGLLARQTRVLVTHHMHFLQHADLIAVIEDGKIAHLGTFDALDSEVSESGFILHLIVIQHLCSTWFASGLADTTKMKLRYDRYVVSGPKNPDTTW